MGGNSTMKILIAGGMGFIGTNVAKEAVKRGHKVVIFDSLIRKGSEENIGLVDAEFIRGDVRCTEDFGKFKDIDAIYNFSANPGIPWSIASPLYDFNVNAGGALNLLEYSRTHGKIPVIFASTNKVYSEEINELPIEKKATRYEWVDKKYQGIPVDFPMDSRGKYPHSPYGCSKAAADLYHQEYFHIFGVPTVINRMSCIYGYYQKGVADQGWIDWFVRQIAFGNGKLEIYGDGYQVRDMLFGTDVARLYLDELENIEKVKGQVFNVGGGMVNTLSLIEAIKYIEGLTGKKANLSYFPERPADQRIYISDISKVEKMLNWKPIIVPEVGVKMMLLKYMRNEN
jgi:CDP-paratose 2-epimerase